MRTGKRKNTISISVARGILLFWFPINILLSVYSLFSWSFLWQQARENYAHSIRMSAQQTENNLENLSDWLQNLFFSSFSSQSLQFTSDRNTQFLTAQKINQEAKPYLEMYPNNITFFVYCREELHIPAVSSYSRSDMGPYLSDFIRDIKSTAEQEPMGKYFLTRVKDRWFLSLYLSQHDVYTGVLMDVEDLLSTMKFPDATAYGFQDMEGKYLFAAGNEKPGNIAFSTPIQDTPLSLEVSIPRGIMLDRFQIMLMASFVLTAAALVSLLAYITYIRHQVTDPLKKLQATIDTIEASNTDELVDINGEKDEIAQVYQTFNSFINRIVHLKLESYEERLARQQTELQYLRLQLRPHFFLNSMKRLYALTQEGQINDVQEYILCLCSHYRFLIYDTTNTISLQEEMQHVQNYIQLQRIGYHLTIECSVTLEVNAVLFQVPPLVIQSFVENSIKYAVEPSKTLVLSIQAQIVPDEDGGSCLDVSIADNGPGIPKQIIDEIDNGSEEFTKKHVGFSNLKHRLDLIYSRKAHIYVYNQPDSGAVVDILIPLDNTYGTPEKKETI